MKTLLKRWRRFCAHVKYQRCIEEIERKRRNARAIARWKENHVR